jgi:hypothetical protein
MLMLAVVVGFLATMSVQPVQSASAQPTGAPIPRLVVHESRGTAGEPLPLGLTMQGGTDGVVVIVTGLIPGMSLSSGTAAGADAWQVPATDLADTWVGPPLDFVGTVDLVAELHLDGARIGDRRPIRIEWIATSRAVAAQVPTTTPVPEAVPTAAPVPMTTLVPEAVPAAAQVPTTTPAPEAAPTAAQVPTAMLAPEAVLTPRQLDHDGIKAEQSGERTREQPGERARQKRVASKATVPMREKKSVAASAPRRAPDAPPLPDRPQEMQLASQPTQPRDEQRTGRVSNDPPGILGLLLPGRRSEPVAEGTNPIGPERMSVATTSSDKATREEADAPSPERMQNQCDYRGCAKDYRSFRASDCTFQPPYGGPRKTCEKRARQAGARSAEVPQRAAQVQAQTPAQQCNPVVCARLFRSFDPSDCTYQPISGGARRTCDR